MQAKQIWRSCIERVAKKKRRKKGESITQEECINRLFNRNGFYGSGGNSVLFFLLLFSTMRRSLRRRHSYPPQTDVAGHESSNTGSSRFSEIAEVETADFRVHEKLEPFVSPLTEANLKYHTSSVSVKDKRLASLYVNI